MGLDNPQPLLRLLPYFFHFLNQSWSLDQLFLVCVLNSLGGAVAALGGEGIQKSHQSGCRGRQREGRQEMPTLLLVVINDLR